jgi:3-dehydroquinate synthase class II
MLDRGTLKSVAEQLMSGKEVVVAGRSSRVTRTGVQRLRTVRFVTEGKEYQAIEQNPEKPSRWGKLAREGHRVVQFRDLESGKYVAAVMDEKVTKFGKRE